MKDKRKIKRRFLLYYMRVYDAATRQQIGNLVDITPRGLMIVSEHPLPEGQTTRLRMELTNEVADKPFMEFAAYSKWCEPDIIQNMYNTGFEILSLLPRMQKLSIASSKNLGFAITNR